MAGFIPISQGHIEPQPEPQPHVLNTYTLKRYTWRAFLSICGPLLLLGLYIFIVFYYLIKPPLNGIVGAQGADARRFFYAWFVISIFTLDWASTALLNAEAVALMRYSLAPRSAMRLMWHADKHWANPLWWCRALTNTVQELWSRRRPNNESSDLKSGPGKLWWMLSTTSFLIFLAVPLSGLSMELTTVSAPSSVPAFILGPTPDTFNFKGLINVPQIARGRWKAGGPTTPSDSSIFYAPNGTPNVSTEYVQDQITLSTNNYVQSFLPPAVNGLVRGKVWGILSNLSCQTVSSEQLKLIKPDSFESYPPKYSVYDRHANNTPIYGNSTISEGKQLFVNETAVFQETFLYSMAAKADGIWYGDTVYDHNTNHDYMTFDAASGATPPNEVTTALFEIYLWQSLLPGLNDSSMAHLLNSPSPSVQVVHRSLEINPNTGPQDLAIAGFGVQCLVKSEMGNADLDPATRTYSSFHRGANASGTGGDDDLYPPQVQAVEAFANYDPISYKLTPYNGQSLSNWLALHLAAGIPSYKNKLCEHSQCLGFLGPVGHNAYAALSPENVTLAAYKLLGESLIAMMGPGNQEPWTGDLVAYQTIYWLKPGIVPWQLVLALLSAWTMVTVVASILTLFTKRWNSALGGFEFFRFGAQWTDEISAFNSQKFQDCKTLGRMPGMVGAMDGGEKESNAEFVGLSRLAADQNGVFVFDRRRAGWLQNGGI